MRSNESVQKFDDPSFYDYIIPLSDKSYRRWERLTKQQQKELKGFTLFPKQLNYILKVYRVLKKHFRSDSINFAVNLGLKTFDNYNLYYGQCLNQGKLKQQLMMPNEALKELKFQGYISLDKFKLEKGMSYTMTNAVMIDGKHYIHPFKMGSNYELVNYYRVPYLWSTFQYFGVPGYIRVIYPEMENYPHLLSKKQTHQIKIDWGIA